MSCAGIYKRKIDQNIFFMNVSIQNKVLSRFVLINVAGKIIFLTFFIWH